jgi:ethanolamine ammonia-lyase small subunit
LLVALTPLLVARGVTSYPVLIAPYARVKIADQIGETLGARHSLILLGERPGLSSPESLGAYVTYRPRAACTDADRNCVSNIRPEGMPAADAAQLLADVLLESAQRGLSGVALKLNA